MFFKQATAAEHLLYADTDICSVTESDGNIRIVAKGYGGENLVIDLLEPRIIYPFQNEHYERVEHGQVIKLGNHRKRLILFNDDNEIFLELEFSKSKIVKTIK